MLTILGHLILEIINNLYSIGHSISLSHHFVVNICHQGSVYYHSIMAFQSGHHSIMPFQSGHHSIMPFKSGHHSIMPFKPGHHSIMPFKPGHHSLMPFKPGHHSIMPSNGTKSRESWNLCTVNGDETIWSI